MFNTLVNPRYRRILTLALPIMGGMLSQNAMNLIDTGMVGSLGPTALAAVGMSSFAAFMAQAFVMGLGEGVQAVSARRHGEGDESKMAIPLNGGLLLAAAIALPGSVLLYFLVPSLYPFLTSDPNVQTIGIPYLQARVCAIVFVGMNFAFRGYFNGVNRSGIYLRSLLSMQIANVAFNYTLIFGKFGFPALGATGAGIGTALATIVGTITYVFLALRHAREAGFLRHWPALDTIKRMASLSAPSGFRQFFFAAGLTVQFWIVGQVSTTAMAAGNVIINLMLVAILPGVGFGISAASLVGQALGRKEPEDAKQWGWDVTKLASLTLLLIGLPMAIIPESLLRIFTTDAATIAVGLWPLRIVGLTIAADGTGLVFQNALVGAGATKTVMLFAIGLQWLVFLPLEYVAGPVLGYGFVGIWVVMAMHRIVQAVVFSTIWARGRWTNIRV